MHYPPDMRSGRLFRFMRIPRLARLYRCPECSAATDDPDGHARTHLPGYRPANPANIENAHWREVIVPDDAMLRPQPAPPDPEPIYHGGRRR